MGVLWVQYGPYHSARLTALQKLAGTARVHALEFSNQTSVYGWNRSHVPQGLITLCPGAVAEKLSFWRVFRAARRTFADLKLDVCFLPSYAPSQSLAALLAAKSLGIRTVMMNESHAGTARAKGLAATVKRRLVALFDTALVGGQPQKRYLASLGMPDKLIQIGYDTVDNDFFAAQAAHVRSRQSEFRNKYRLPEHYFLSLGRFVPKKNLAALLRSYQQVLATRPDSQTHLVLVGSGVQEAALRALSHELHLRVYDKISAGYRVTTSPMEPEPPGVHFYGFRQIDENPLFYALADAFILPSLYEEWGLVVNEAMACGLPVVVSESAGCAEDLLAPDHLPAPPVVSPDLQVRLAQFTGGIRQNGFLFDPQSIRELTDALILLETAPEIREIMGGASRQIIGHFSCETFATNALLAANAALARSVPHNTP
jgi:glycosyltransferase involved in cell wall biosynthesis